MGHTTAHHVHTPLLVNWESILVALLATCVIGNNGEMLPRYVQPKAQHNKVKLKNARSDTERNRIQQGKRRCDDTLDLRLRRCLLDDGLHGSIFLMFATNYWFAEYILFRRHPSILIQRSAAQVCVCVCLFGHLIQIHHSPSAVWTTSEDSFHLSIPNLQSLQTTRRENTTNRVPSSLGLHERKTTISNRIFHIHLRFVSRSEKTKRHHDETDALFVLIVSVAVIPANSTAVNYLGTEVERHDNRNSFLRCAENLGVYFLFSLSDTARYSSNYKAKRHVIP